MVKDFSIDEALKFGWNTMKANFWFFVGILVVAWVVVNIPFLLGNFLRNESLWFYMLFTVIGWVLQLIVGIGLIRISLKFCSGETPEFNDLFRFKGYFWRYLGGSLLLAIAVTAGFMLFVVPGVIWAIMFQFYALLIIDKNKSITDAFKHSAEVTKSIRWKLLGFGLLLALINYLGILVFLVGLLATIPTTMLAYTWVYRKLLEQTPSTTATNDVNVSVNIYQ